MNVKAFIEKYGSILVVLWGMILFIPFLGSVHLFDWDEINFAESAREMMATADYQKVQINYLPFMEKPPLFFWLQVISMKVFGINEMAARLPNAIIGIITLLLIYRIGKKWYTPKLGILWVLMVSGSLTPHLYYKSGIIDPLYNLFIFLSIYQLFLYVVQKNVRHAWFMGMFLGLAIITKGPVAVVVLVLCFLVYWAMQKFKRFFQWTHILYTFLAALTVSAAWFGVETIERGPVFLLEFLKYQADLFLHPVADHGQPFYYHPIVLLLGCFPASVFALPVLLNRNLLANKPETQQRFFAMMMLLFWVVLILFSIVETKIVHYSSLCYLPLTFMAALFLSEWQQAGIRLYRFQWILFGLIGFVLSFAFVLLPQIDEIKDSLIPFIKDPFAVASLSVSGGWRGYEILPGIILFMLMIYAWVMLVTQKVWVGSIRFLLIHSLLIPTLLWLLAPRIEAYSQGPAIRFFEKYQGQDVYLTTLGYKSYAPYFYGRTQPGARPESKDNNWLVTGNIDKDAYFVLHVNHVEGHVNGDMKEIGREGGFVFYYRPATDSTFKK